MAVPDGVKRLDRTSFRRNVRHYSQTILTGEIAVGDDVAEDGAEGATAPETLRHRDRGKMALWRVRSMPARRPGISTEGEDWRVDQHARSAG